MQQIDKELRTAIMQVVHRLAYYHPELKTTAHDSRVPECWVCRDVGIVLDLLEAEQREYGPPIAVTDPSWLREHSAGAPA